MDIERAKVVYASPGRHTKVELKRCLNVLNEAAQPIELDGTRFTAIQDAIKKLGGVDNVKHIRAS